MPLGPMTVEADHLATKGGCHPKPGNPLSTPRNPTYPEEYFTPASTPARRHHPKPARAAHLCTRPHSPGECVLFPYYMALCLYLPHLLVNSFSRIQSQEPSAGLRSYLACKEMPPD